jgi:hypothetical protein
MNTFRDAYFNNYHSINLHRIWRGHVEVQDDHLLMFSELGAYVNDYYRSSLVKKIIFCIKNNK